MLTWNRFPFVRLSFSAITGILIYEHIPVLWSSPILPFILVSCVYLGIWFWLFQTKSFPAKLISGFTGLVIVAFLFGWVAKLNIEINTPHHWRNTPHEIIAFEGRINSPPLEKVKTRRYTVELLSVSNGDTTTKSSGQIHLYTKKDSTDLTSLQRDGSLKYGDIIHVLARPSAIPAPTNPEEFDYSSYIARQQINGQCFVNSQKIRLTGNAPKHDVMALALNLREKFSEMITAYIKNEQTKSIALALLIGRKDFLSDELKTAYSSAGAMHVLAVSGLHVGILYMVLLTALRPLKKRRLGKIIIAIVSISIIWMYTLVTGMSPSVLRAAVMFTVMATSETMNRDNNIYNSLGIAAFILLLWDPNLLFSVGFQLSFLALTGIIYLQPKIYSLLYTPNFILNKIWEITAVSIAAQLATLPLTIYYFHQFPTYFFLSNLVVIPGAGIIMFMGIAMLILGLIHDQTGSLIGYMLDHTIQLMNYLVTSMEKLPGSLITWLYIDSIQVILIYLSMVIVLIGLFHRNSFYLGISVTLILSAITWGSFKKWDQSGTSEMVIYDLYTTTAIDQINGNQASLFVSAIKQVDSSLLKFQIDPYRRAKGLNSFDEDIREFKEMRLNAGLKAAIISNTRVITLDSLLSGINIKSPIETDILIINNQSVKSIKWLHAHFKYSQLIIGSQNSFYYSNWLKKKLSYEGKDVHSLLLDGHWRQSFKER